MNGTTLLAALGSAGLGLVWGWLICGAARDTSLRQRSRTMLLLSLGAVGLALQAGVLNGAWTAVLLGAAAVLGLWLHSAWLGELRARFAHPPQ